MKKQGKKHLFWLFLFWSSFAFAAAPTLTYQITGLEKPVLTNVQNRLNVKWKPYLNNLTETTIRKLFNRGPSEIIKAVEPYGFFKAKVRRELLQKGNAWTAVYNVSPGLPIRINELSIGLSGAGKNDSRLNQIIKDLPIKPNSIFNVENYESSKNLLLNQAQKEGFIFARLATDTVHVQLRSYTCEMVITLDTGPRYYFGAIKFSKTPLGLSLLKRYLNFKPGEIFSYPKLVRAQQALNGSSYFQLVSVLPQKDKITNRRVPVQVNLSMNKKHSYMFGIGYGTNTGARLTANYEARWLNSLGHKLFINTRISQLEQSISGQYQIPGKDPTKDKYFLSGGIFRIRPRDGESFSGSISAGLIKTYEDWQATWSLNFMREKFREVNTDPYQISTLLMPTLSLVDTDADSTLQTVNGSRLQLMFSGATKSLFSTLNFFQTEVRYKWIRTFAENYRFIFMGCYGYTFVDNLDDLPLSKRFYAGGLDSNRGYDFQDLGPGKYLVLANFELQRRVYKEWYGAVFYDAGNAMNKLSESLKPSVGVGVVWQSPVGSFKIYLGKALRDPGRKLNFEFGLGPDL